MAGFKRGHLGPVEQHQILANIGKEIVSGAPDNWERLEYSAKSIISGTADLLVATYDDGQTESIDMPDSILGMLRELRAGMYQEAKGTWYSMKYTIVRPGNFNTEFNYDSDPGFTFEPTPEEFVRDLQYFPRDDEYIPAWLREKIRAAEEGGE
ncbi:hypothetical protein [Nocardiopsis rhodophaea]|uniref:hypothetical protein n=1 Tax=Nocardiopsis rhodophaea TaxID=280238 RepID=UPI0031E06645